MNNPRDIEEGDVHPTAEDRRLYVPYLDSVEVRVKADHAKEYCYLKATSQDYYHLLVAGEVYVQRGHEKFCLDCAYKVGIVTSDRQHWQRRTSMMSHTSSEPDDAETFEILPPREE